MLFDTRGSRLDLDGLEAALDRLERQLGLEVMAAVYGTSDEQRVYELRRSILGDEAGPAPGRIEGLVAALGRVA